MNEISIFKIKYNRKKFDSYYRQLIQDFLLNFPFSMQSIQISVMLVTVVMYMYIWIEKKKMFLEEMKNCLLTYFFIFVLILFKKIHL